MEVVVELSGTCVTYVHIFGGFDVSSSSSAVEAVEAASNSLWGSAILFVRCDEMGVGGVDSCIGLFVVLVVVGAAAAYL